MLILVICLFCLNKSFKEYNDAQEKKNKFGIPEISDDDEMRNNLTSNGPTDISVEESDLDSPTEDPKFDNIIDDIEEDRISKNEEMKLMVDKVNRLLKSDNVKSPLDPGVWISLVEYIQRHIEDFLVDGHLGLEFQIKYLFCFYFVAFIPAQFAIAFPSILLKFIPKSVFKIPFVADFFIELDSFLRFARQKSEKTFIITFFVGRKNGLSEELEMLKRLPSLIFNDPGQLVEYLMSFKVDASGYDEFKKTDTMRQKNLSKKL